jgi:hypothetical protein
MSLRWVLIWVCCRVVGVSFPLPDVTTTGLTATGTTGVLQQAGTSYSSGAPGFTLIRSRVRHARVCLYFMYFLFCIILLFSCFLGLYNVLRLPLWFFLPFFVISLFNNRFNRYRMETYMFILTKSKCRKGSNNCTGPHREDID